MNNDIIPSDISIRNALKAMHIAGKKCLIVAKDDKTLLGTLSDGDLRKEILKNTSLDQSIEGVYNANPTYFLKNKYTLTEAKDILINQRFDFIPIVNNKKIIIDVLYWEKVFEIGDNKFDKLSCPVVIMAGGRGTRLDPFTKVLPKALIPVNEKTIIEHIIERFTDFGCDNFYLTVNYKSRILKAFFEELNPNYQVHFVEEDDPLGTAGSLRLLNGKFDQPFLVSNCDIIINIDTSLYEYHLKNGYDITVVASTKEYIIPYGTCELNDDGCLSHINEKPKYDFLINTGLYIINPDILTLIPKDKFYHITHLIEDAKINGKKVGVFPVDEEAWIDVGQWAEYEKAVKKI
tara:strand:- start:1880 stop:2923 length:1044 start_codon:yes stop_codon:yes gene_type:complete